MKIRVILLAVVWVLAGAAVCSAQDSQIGTWTLNEAKSHLAKGAPKNTTVVYEMAGDQTKVTVDGVDAAGNPTHSEWTGKFDGKPYPVTGDPLAETRTYRRINSRTLTLTHKKDGKISLTGRIVVAANGKTRTVTTTSRDAKGRRITNTAVYDKG